MTLSREHSPGAEALARGYEPTDVNYNGLFMFVVFFLLTAVVLHTGLWVLLLYYLQAPRAADRTPSAIPLVRQFPEPRLQPSVTHNRLPYEDLAEMKEAEHQVFEKLGWEVEAGGKRVVIPEQVVSKLAQRHPAATTRAAGGEKQAQEGGK